MRCQGPGCLLLTPVLLPTPVCFPQEGQADRGLSAPQSSPHVSSGSPPPNSSAVSGDPTAAGPQLFQDKDQNDLEWVVSFWNLIKSLESAAQSPSPALWIPFKLSHIWCLMLYCAPKTYVKRENLIVKYSYHNAKIHF